MAGIVQLAAMLLGMFLKLIGKLRLTVPFLYTVLMCTVLARWAAANEVWAVGILVTMLVVVAASWVVTLVRKVRGIQG